MGGKHRIRMNDLKKTLTAQGFINVRTYIQSGNLVFDSEENDPRRLAEMLGRIITDAFGFAVPVVVLGKGELEKIVDGNPFVNERHFDESTLHVTFMTRQPENNHLHEILNIQSPPDEILSAPKAMYLHCPDGYARTRFSNEFFEKKLNTTATTRNWKTVKKLWGMMNED